MGYDRTREVSPLKNEREVQKGMTLLEKQQARGWNLMEKPKERGWEGWG